MEINNINYTKCTSQIQNHSHTNQLLGLIYQWNETWGIFSHLKDSSLQIWDACEASSSGVKQCFFGRRVKCPRKNWRNKVKQSQTRLVMWWLVMTGDDWWWLVMTGDDWWTDMETWAIPKCLGSALVLGFKVGDNLSLGIPIVQKNVKKDLMLRYGCSNATERKKIRNPYKLWWKQTTKHTVYRRKQMANEQNYLCFMECDSTMFWCSPRPCQTLEPLAWMNRFEQMHIADYTDCTCNSSRVTVFWYNNTENLSKNIDRGIFFLGSSLRLFNPQHDPSKTGALRMKFSELRPASQTNPSNNHTMRHRRRNTKCRNSKRLWRLWRLCVISFGDCLELHLALAGSSWRLHGDLAPKSPNTQSPRLLWVCKSKSDHMSTVPTMRFSWQADRDLSWSVHISSYFLV